MAQFTADELIACVQGELDRFGLSIEEASGSLFSTFFVIVQNSFHRGEYLKEDNVRGALRALGNAL